MSTRQHSERCRECKKSILKLLKHIYGQAVEGYSLNLPARLEDYRDKEFYGALRKIYTELQRYRGFDQFVLAKRLPPVDYYVQKPGLIIEFDESQHFTRPREIALRNYPKGLGLGYSKDKWIRLCRQLDRKDNDPPYRDEQRAWYDTLRDFASLFLQIPLIRVLPDENIWCSLSPHNPADIQWFASFIDSKLRA